MLFDCCYCEARTNCIKMGKLEMIVISCEIILKLNLNLVKMQAFDTG